MDEKLAREYLMQYSRALRVPYTVVGEYAKPTPHVNGLAVTVTERFLSDARIVDITAMFR